MNAELLIHLVGDRLRYGPCVRTRYNRDRAFEHHDSLRAPLKHLRTPSSEPGRRYSYHRLILVLGALFWLGMCARDITV